MIPLFSGSSVKVVFEDVRNLTVLLFAVSLIGISAFSISCSDESDTDGNRSSSSRTSASPAAGTAVNSGDGTSVKSAQGSITATPNPVPAGQGGGKTRVSWKTPGDVTPVEVYVVQDGQPEVKFAQGSEGAVDAPWINAGSTYEFRLYAGSGAGRKMIGKVEVTRTP